MPWNKNITGNKIYDFRMHGWNCIRYDCCRIIWNHIIYFFYSLLVHICPVAVAASRRTLHTNCKLYIFRAELKGSKCILLKHTHTRAHTHLRPEEREIRCCFVITSNSEAIIRSANGPTGAPFHIKHLLEQQKHSMACLLFAFLIAIMDPLIGFCLETKQHHRIDKQWMRLVPVALAPDTAYVSVEVEGFNSSLIFGDAKYKWKVRWCKILWPPKHTSPWAGLLFVQSIKLNRTLCVNNVLPH